MSDRFYLTASAALGADASGFRIADRMTSLAATGSANGILRFVDVDVNGLVNSGDRLDVRLPSTGSPNAWYTYLVMIGNWSAMAPSNAAGVHVILAGQIGPLEVLLDNRRNPFLNPQPAGNQVN